MRLAVLSDIHSNAEALLVCVDYIEKQKVDGILFLGDNVSDCPDPEETLRIIRELDQNYRTWHIKGNREEYFISHADGAEDGWCYSSYKGSLLYTYEHLGKEDIQIFRGYPDSRRVEIEGAKDIILSHGSPDSLRELLYPGASNTNRCMEKIDADYLLCGHTHQQYTYGYQGKMLINPGSVGVAIGVSAAAHFAVLDWKNGRWNHRFLELPYDFRKLKQRFFKSSLMEKANIWPKCILKSIETGVNIGPICAKTAYDLAAAENAAGKDRIVPEKYWHMAANKIGIIQEDFSGLM